MGSIPLPALDIRPPQAQPDPLEQYGRLLAIKNQMAMQPLQQQAAQQQVQTGQVDLQQKQQQLQDQQAISTSMQEWDGKDYNELYPLMLKNGASGTAVLGLKQKVLEQQQSVSQTLKNNAEAGQAQIATAKTKGDMLDGALSPLIDPKQTPDDQLPQAIISTAQNLVQRGILDQQHAQAAEALAQGDPTTARQQLDLLRKSNLAQSQIIEDAAKQSGIAKDTAQAGEANANTQRIQTLTEAGALPEMADAKYRQILEAQNLGQPVSATDQAFKAAYEKQKTLVPTANFNLQNAGVGGQGGAPSALAQAVASGQMKWGDVISPRTPMSVKTQFANEVRSINPNFNSGDFSVEQKGKEAFISGAYSQQLNAINTARNHMQTFSELADALDNNNVQTLNKIGNAFGVQFGSDKATNLRIAAQAFGGEVGRAFNGAGVTQGERDEAGKSLGDYSSPAQFRGAIQTVDKLLAGKQTALQQTYQQGQHAQPNFGGNSGGGPENSSDPFAQFGGKAHQ